MTFMAMWTLAYTFAYVFACGTDLNITWHAAPKWVQESCVNTFMLAYSHRISDFVTDFVVITIPLPFVSLLVSKIGHVLR